MHHTLSWARVVSIALASTAAGLALARPAAALEFSELAVVGRSEGRADIFGIDADDHSASHMWQWEAAGPWVGPEFAGSSVVDLTPVELSDDRFEVFAAGSGYEILHSAQDYDTWAWPAWEALPGGAKRVAAAKAADGTVALFYVGTDDSIWYGTRSANDVAFSDWTSLELIAKDVAVVAALGGGFDLYAVLADDTTRVAHIEPAAPESPEWVNLGGQARSVSAIHASSGEDVVAVIGFDDAVWLQRRTEADWSGWKSPGGSGTRVEVVEIDGALNLLTLSNAALVARATENPDGSWTEWSPVVEASPLESVFVGTATLAIPDQDVEASQDLELRLRFDVSRRQVSLTSFPAIRTEPFDTPFGSTRSTVTLVSSRQGTFDPDTGRLDLPVTLQFDQSLDVPLISEDARAAFNLSTSASGGEVLDRESGRVTLADTGAFDGSGSINPLDGLEVGVVIDGVLDPAP